MEESGILNVVTDLSLGSNIVLHPNDGFDLGLLTYSRKIKLFLNTTIQEFNSESGEFKEGELLLENKCKHNQVIMSSKAWEKMGKPHKVKLFLNNDKLLICNM